jgi:long-chain acyl-CoA synthetase
MSATIAQLFLDVCDSFHGRTDKHVYVQRVNGAWTHLTHDQLKYRVEAFAEALLRLGINPGDRVGIVAENRLDWPMVDFAMVGMGVIDVPVFPTLTAKQLQFIYADCSATCVIVSNATQLNKIEQVWNELPDLKHVIVMNDVQSDDPRVVSLQKLIDDAESTTDAKTRAEQYRERAMSVSPDDTLTLIYTSGTTGNPKGVILTHGNLISNVMNSKNVVTLSERDSLLSYLPLCHIFERMAGFYLAFSVGATVTITDSIETVAELMQIVRPTIMTSVPRLFERIRMRVLGNVQKEAPLKQAIFQWAFSVGEKWINGHRGPIMGIQHAIADKLVFSKVRARTGGNLRFFVSGGAALNPEIGRFFQILGIVILEGYGLTESSPVISIHRLEDVVIGTVGTPLSSVEVRIAPDGEILARGASIMKGYWNNPEATRESLDEQGFLHTGDIGILTDRGHLKITDRKKHLLVSSGGKNIAPQPIEAAIAQCQYVDQVIVIGDAREYCTAIVVLDKDAVKGWGEKHGASASTAEEIAQNQQLISAIERELNALQKDLSKYEKARRYAFLVEPFTVENGLLTPTLKVKRKAVLERYADLIDGLYSKGD